MKNNVNTNSRLRRDCSVVDVHDEKLYFLKILPRKIRQDTFQTCEQKSCTSCVTDIFAFETLCFQYVCLAWQ